MKVFNYLSRKFGSFFRRFSRRWKLVIIEGDSLPARISQRTLILARDDGEDWCVGMQCPCGCSKTIELMLVPEARPRWKLTVDKEGRPSLSPSVWLKSGCRSHFWLRSGQVVWCKGGGNDC